MKRLSHLESTCGGPATGPAVGPGSAWGVGGGRSPHGWRSLRYRDGGEAVGETDAGRPSLAFDPKEAGWKLF